jgi:hypothetical protein
MGYTGPEHPPKSSGNTGVVKQLGADSGAGDAPDGAAGVVVDPGLSVIIAAWPALPVALKAGIVAMVNAAR